MDTLITIGYKDKFCINKYREMNKEELIKAIDEIGVKQYLSVSIVKQVTDNLKNIKTHLSKKAMTKCERLIELISMSSNLKNETKKEIITLKKPIIKAIQWYYEKYKNEDEVEGEKTEKEIEEMLDQKIPSYTRYSKENPMHGVSFYKAKKQWRLKLSEFNKKSTDMTGVISAAKEALSIQKDTAGIRKYAENTKKIQFIYQKHYFMSYWYENDPYFDIQHIISALNLKTTAWNAKYNEFSKKISCYTWHENKYKGYIMRELIDEISMHELIMSSNSDISHIFKKDIAKIHIEFRKSGELEITNEKVSKKGNDTEPRQVEPRQVEPTQVEPIQVEPTQVDLTIPKYVYSYKNPNDMLHVRSLVYMGTKIMVNEYMNQNVMYAFVVQIETKHTDVIVKIGYTEDIIRRYQELKAEYKCNKIHLIHLKYVTGRRDESKFHKMMKTVHPDLSEEYKIRSKKKVELYKLSPLLMDLLEKYVVIQERPIGIRQGSKKGGITEVEQPVINEIKKQDMVFYQCMTENKVDEGLMINKYNYKCIMEREKTNREQLLKVQEIRLAEIGKETEKEIRLAEIARDIEVAKLENEKYDKKIILAKIRKESLQESKMN
jgi:hypothetical protein